VELFASFALRNADMNQQPFYPAGGASAARPDAFGFPVKGICYFLAHPALWPRLICPLVCGVFLVLIFLVTFFAVLLGPQEKLLLRWFGDSGWAVFWAWFCSILLVLVEVAIATFVTVQLAIQCILQEVFVKVMKVPPSRHLADCTRPRLVLSYPFAEGRGCVAHGRRPPLPPRAVQHLPSDRDRGGHTAAASAASSRDSGVLCRQWGAGCLGVPRDLL
jgi:hypothetical protein